MRQDSIRRATRGQVISGGTMLIFAGAAGTIGLIINFRFGFASGAGANYLAAGLFATADCAKFGLLLMIGAGSWTLRMRATLWSIWALCLMASLWAATNSYINENAAELFQSQAKADELRGARTDSAGIRNELDLLRPRIDALGDVVDIAALEGAASMTAAAARREMGRAVDAGISCDARRDCAKAQAAAEQAKSRFDGMTKRAEQRAALEGRRAQLETALANLKSEVHNTTREGKAHAPGLAQLASMWLGWSESTVGQGIGLVKAVLFIGLIEGLIFLAEPGISLLFPHQPEPLPEPTVAPVIVEPVPVAPAAEPAVQVATKRVGMTGNELRELRASLGLTQQQMADRCGANLSTYLKWEHAYEAPIPKKAATLVTATEERLAEQSSGGVVVKLRRG